MATPENSLDIAAFLTRHGISQSRSEAKRVVLGGQVTIDGTCVDKITDRVALDQGPVTVRIGSKRVWDIPIP